MLLKPSGKAPGACWAQDLKVAQGPGGQMAGDEQLWQKQQSLPPSSALSLPRGRSAQKYRLSRVSRTMVHTCPSIPHLDKGLWGEADGVTIIPRELGPTVIKATHLHTNQLLILSIPKVRFGQAAPIGVYSLLREDRVTSMGGRRLCSLHFRPGSALQHLSLQTGFQSSPEFQNPMRLFNSVTSLLPKLRVCWGRGT